MSEFTMDRLRENLESLKMKNTLEILDNYLERAVADKLNIVEVLDHIFSEEAKSKRRRAYEKQIQMSGFPIKKTLDDFDFSFQPSIDKRQIDELATMRFLENGENVVFLGPPGVGKTHLASALGLVAVDVVGGETVLCCHQAQGGGQMGLAHAGRAEEDHILPVFQEAHGGQLIDLAFIDGGLEREIEVVQGGLV